MSFEGDGLQPVHKPQPYDAALAAEGHPISASKFNRSSPALVALDLGAQSCRVSLLRWGADGPSIELVHRIPNTPISHDGALRWDLPALTAAADHGLLRAAELAPEGVSAIGVTGWAVDYVRLTPAGEPIADPFCYRDPRTGPAQQSLHRRIPPERLYALTGIQELPFNTLYQLHADSLAGIPPSLPWLNLPEYFLHRWGAPPVAEFTNATHTAMVALDRMQWSPEIFSAADLDPSAAPEIVPPGTILGRLTGPLAAHPALRNAQLIAPACHDTASAIAGIPAEGDRWAFISSGTWSLVGTVLDRPCAGPKAAERNFTNLGAAGGGICFLRNVNGLWLLDQSIESWHAAGISCSREALLEAVAALPAPGVLLNVDDPALLAPGDMPARIARQLGQSSADFSSPAAMTSLILHSLARRYAEVLGQAAQLTGKQFDRLYIAGGGSRNTLLNRLTQQATGLPVHLGPKESSTLGNFAVQLAALEQSPSSRAAIARWAAQLSSALRP